MVNQAAPSLWPPGRRARGTMRAMGIGNLLVVALFSLVGFAAFRYGKKAGETKPMVLGAVLMAYGYVVSNVWVSLLVGGVLTALIFI